MTARPLTQQDALRCLQVVWDAVLEPKAADPASVTASLAIVEDYLITRRLLTDPLPNPASLFTNGAA